MPIGVAIVGSGIFAKEAHLPAVQASADVLELRAIYSRSLSSAKGLAHELQNVELYSDDAGDGHSYQDLLLREDIKGVIIVLPILAQPQYIQQALSAGKHVLAEKPIAKDVKTAEDLLDWYSKNDIKATFCIAEQFRLLESFHHAAQQIKQMGRLLGFRVRVQSMINPGGKYFETKWRKFPEYQGGFLLDGGVHFIAALRLMLGEENRPTRICAFTAQNQQHLPPVDTADAIVLTKTGISGTFSLSFGTTFGGHEYLFACEKGTVSVSPGTVTCNKDGESNVTGFESDKSAVDKEVRVWGESLQAGKPSPQLAPNEALKDLQFLEALLQSGNHSGGPVEII